MFRAWQQVWDCSILRAELRFPRAIDQPGMGCGVEGRGNTAECRVTLWGLGQSCTLLELQPPFKTCWGPGREWGCGIQEPSGFPLGESL